MKKQSKPFKSFEEQIDILSQRGLTINDYEAAKEKLCYINYYRLSAYSLTLRKNDVFYKGITFDNIVELYNMDESFRNIILKYTKYIECAFRTHIAYYHSQQYGPLGYLKSETFLDPWRHATFITRLESSIKTSREIFIEHHREDLNGQYPFWVAVEVTSFDMISKLFSNLKPQEKNTISKLYFVAREYVVNWLQSCVIARNIAAHGGRFYNRIKLQAVKLPKCLKNVIDKDRTFAYVFAIFKLLPNNTYRNLFKNELDNLFKEYTFGQSRHYGFPDDWKTILEEQMPKM